MRILMISAEAPPLHRAGALVDVLDALPHELREQGHEVSVVLPFYREIRENSLTEVTDTGVTVDIRVGEKNYVAEYFESRTASGVQLFFVRCDEFFDRPGIYGEHGIAYEDNVTRFIFFNKAAIELARRLTPVPQILHAHDWAAALIPVYIHAHNLPFATVLTIHRLAEQGSFWGLDFALTNLPQRFFSLRGVEFFGRLNFLKGGIVFADRISAKSSDPKAAMNSTSFSVKMPTSSLASCTAPITRAGIRQPIRCCRLISNPKNYGAKRFVVTLCSRISSSPPRRAVRFSEWSRAWSPKKVLEFSLRSSIGCWRMMCA